MSEKSIHCNLNCVYATMLNTLLELEKNEILLKYFAVKGSTLKGYRRTVMIQINPNFTTRIVYSIKVLLHY